MSDIVPKRIAELSHYQGAHEIPGVRFCYAAKDLGITAWGMNVLELAPHCTTYPEHDHLEDGEEEAYVVLSGSAVLVVGGRKWPLEAGMLVRVGPEHKRKLVTGSRGAVVLALGGVPEKADGAAPQGTAKGTPKKPAAKKSAAKKPAKATKA